MKKRLIIALYSISVSFGADPQQKTDGLGNVFTLETFPGKVMDGYRLTVAAPNQKPVQAWRIDPDLLLVEGKWTEPQIRELQSDGGWWSHKLQMDLVAVAEGMATILSYTGEDPESLNPFWLIRGKLDPSKTPEKPMDIIDLPEFIRVSGYQRLDYFHGTPIVFKLVDPFTLEITTELLGMPKTLTQLHWPLGAPDFGLWIRSGRKGPFVLERSSRSDPSLIDKISAHVKAGTWFDKAPEYELTQEQIKLGIKKPE